MMKNTITKYLKELGIPVNLKGYHYLRYAIELMVEDISLLTAITKKLYPAVGEKFNISASAAERGIRNAIETGWDRGNIETQEKIFGYTIDFNRAPTNSEFIATVADYILLESEGK